MIGSFFGNEDAKKLKGYQKDLQKIHQKREEYKNFSLSDIQTKNKEISQRLQHIDHETEEGAQSLKTMLQDAKIDAAALWVRSCELLSGSDHIMENGNSIHWNMVPYDVQIIGGLAIHDGNVAEMKTGEGKTLVATFPAYLNALSGNSVHIVTVNDYLATRDANEMGVLYKALGLSVGVITHNQSKDEKKENYARDIVYATNNELGFDYLRDNMAVESSARVMGKKFFAIVDEVDSILIDEARTPLIISMPDNQPTAKYIAFANLAKKLQKGTDYKIDEKAKTSTLSAAGIEKIEKMLGVDNIYVSSRYNELHHIENAIRAISVYKKDTDYIIRDNEVMIVDEHTGRVLPGRRYGDGMHQALEAKEGVQIQQESKTLASITFQNYFRMYWKLAGMTGTAKTEEEEFYKVYGLETLVIPTNKPIIRDDRADLLFKNEVGKFEYVLSYIEELHKTGQPILVGTVSVSKSEYLSKKLTESGIPHNVLNAKQHEKEAEIVAAAGQKGAVTIATNMAGRGTDIKLGEGVVDLGGLIILGTEKHETRRIDNQLRGRAGRQGDPGMTQYLISPNDDIMRIFGGDKVFGVFNSPFFASLPDNEPLTQSKMLTSKVLGVQKQVEGHNFDARKHLLEYDDVMNKHREIVYRKRNRILDESIDHITIDEKIENMVRAYVNSHVNVELAKNPDTPRKNIINYINTDLRREIIDDPLEKEDVEGYPADKLADYIASRALAEVEVIRSEAPGIEAYYEIVKRIMLQSIDILWMNHIDAMTKLREQVAFAGYAQKQPLMVYKEEAYHKFEALFQEIDSKIVKSIFAIGEIKQVELKEVDEGKLQVQSDDVDAQSMKKTAAVQAQSNPLFAAPAPAKPPTKVKEKHVKKIRV